MALHEMMTLTRHPTTGAKSKCPHQGPDWKMTDPPSEIYPDSVDVNLLSVLLLDLKIP